MKAIITKISPYNSGKGAFIWLNEKKHAYFGKIEFAVDEEVEYSLGENQFNGCPSIKEITVAKERKIKEIHHEQAQRQGGNLIGTSHLSKPQNPPAAQSNDIITWLSCLKSACIYNSKCQCDKKTLVEYADYFYEASKRISGKCKECGGGN